MTQSTAESLVSDAASALPSETCGALRPWGDTKRDPHERVQYLLDHMTVDEKLSQLVGLWVGSDSSGAGVAPYQHDMSQAPPVWDDVIAGGLGQLTRFFGTRPVEPGVGARSLAASQAQIVAANPWGIPALAHEECLTGFATWRATSYPVPLACWLYYSDAGQEFAKWGVQGTTYNKEASGVRKLVPDVNYNGLNPAGTKDLRVDFGFSGGVFAYGGTTDLLQSMMSPEEIEFQKAMKSKTPEALALPAPLSDAVREQYTMLATPLQDSVDQATLQFILGQRDLSQFDAFVTELKGKGMTTYTDMKNKAYQDFKKK